MTAETLAYLSAGAAFTALLAIGIGALLAFVRSYRRRRVMAWRIDR